MFCFPNYLYLLTTVFLFVITIKSKALGLQASFYGDSYVRVPMQDASSHTDIKLHFRTSAPNGLLLLAAGTTDYCKVLLQNGAVQVGLDLGSGEASLLSPPGIIFNDLQWHFVHVSRTQGRVVLTIDGIYSSESVTPGRFFELNIDHDVFVGGTGAFDGRVYFGNFRFFRGCLRNVTFGDVDVLRTGRDQLHSFYVYAVTWDCAPEFGATSDQPISFVRNTSYVAFPTLEVRQGGRVTFDMRTRSHNALVVYNSGPLPESDFLAVEIVDGRLNLRVNKGSGAVVLTSERAVNDGSWHQVELVIDAISARLSVDGHRKEEKINFGNTRFLDITTLLYVGGVGVVARAVAVQKKLTSLSGLDAAAGSLIGCVQNFKVDGRLLGFRDVVHSRDIQPECAWLFPCSHNPCVDDAQCVETGFYVYRCQCPRPECYRNGTKLILQPDTTVRDILRVQDMVVKEGGKSLISVKNLDLVVDYGARGIRDSSVSFKVLEKPNHGEIVLDGGRKPPARQLVFTVADLRDNRVWYSNDGSEATSDRAVLQLEFLSVGPEVPDDFRRKYRFTLVIQVASWNDQPEIHLPPDNTLVVVTNTKLGITPRMIRAADTDDSPASLEFTVLYQQGSDVGYFELNEYLGVLARITRFTQEDIDDGKLSFVHRGQQHQQLTLQVSDGKDIGDSKTLKIVAVPLTVSMIANTGLVLQRNSTRLLSKRNLTFTTNTPDQDFEVRYQVVEAPYFGEIQRQQYAENQWIVASAFTQKHIDRGRVRYVHNGSSGSQGQDHFSFKVTASNVETAQFDFLIKVVDVGVNIVRMTGLTLRSVQEAVVTSDELKVLSTLPDHGPSEVVYRIQRIPRQGQLMRSEARGSGRAQKKNIGTGSNFTQTDINDKLISYKLAKTSTERTVDGFEFIINVPGFSSKVYQFEIVYEPADGDLVFVNTGLLDVGEGELKPITRDDLFVAKGPHDDFSYLITDGPHHGAVQIVTSNQTITTVTTFLNDDIKKGRLFYRHDGSETEEDSFSFTALYERSDPDINEVPGKFEIKVLLKNDNEPRLVVNRTFYVVANKGRVITQHDILFVDPDIDFDSSNLVYEWRNIPNGVIVFRDEFGAEDAPVITKFPQKHISEGLLYFKHTGSNHSKSLLTVSDGLHLTSHLQEVVACDPFVRVLQESFLFTNKGQKSVLLESTFGVDTNIDAADRDVQFMVVEPPSHGLLKLGDGDGQYFTWADIKDHLVVYEHDSSDGTDDDFGFLVKVEDVEVRGRTLIRVTQILNRIATVEELETVNIDERTLRVTNSHTAPTNITYLITSPPKYGSLVLATRREGPVGPLLAFTQGDINLNRLRYEHHTEGEYVDSFQFDVRLDNASLLGQSFLIEVTSTHGSVPFHTRNLTVIETQSVRITNDTFVIKSRSIQSRDIQFVVVRHPSHGRLQNVDVPSFSVTQFTIEQLGSGKILYQHTGNGTQSDRLLVMAKTSPDTDKQIGPKILWINVRPANNAPPRLVVNKKLRVWQGSETRLKNDHLLTEDDDSYPIDLTYFISRPTIGEIFLFDSRGNDVTIRNFTQADVNNHLIIFRHKASSGYSSGFFKFNISDGKNILAQQTFDVEIEPLVLALVTSGPLGVFPGVAQPITTSVLKATTNDPHTPRSINYVIQQRPTHGKVVTSRGQDNINEEVNTFSQEELDLGVIFYRYNNNTLGVQQSLEDSFVFDISTAYASSAKSQTFIVCVSFENLNAANHDQFIAIQGTSVDEGGRVDINKNALDISKYKRKLLAAGLRGPEVYFILQDIPMRGNLTVNGRAVVPGDNFTQNDINQGLVVYQHDHSDTTTDYFSFVLKIELTGGLSLRSTCILPPLVITYNISIRPVNDHTFTLLTDFPSIELIQGSVSIITNRTLNTTDPDTPPSAIKYEINTPPNNGFIALTKAPRTKIKIFSQEDVDSNTLIFVHNGLPGDGAFYFNVSDGRHKPLFKVFNIRVRPIRLDVVKIGDVEILQGHFSALLTPRNMNLSTNVGSQQITYNVTRSPVYGLLYLGNWVTNHFSHRDIEEGLVAYVQTDWTSSNDSFEFSVTDNVQNVMDKLRLNVVVKPCLKLGERPVQFMGQTSVKITLNDLDATELSILTGSDPEYSVIRGPSRGQLVLLESVKEVRKKKKVRGIVTRDTKVTRKEKAKDTMPKYGRDKSRLRHLDSATFHFTHDDVVREKVEYRSRNEAGSKVGEEGTGKPMKDDFTFVLSARNAQPVTGMLRIDVIQPTMAPEKDQEKSEMDGVDKGRSTQRSDLIPPTSTVEPPLLDDSESSEKVGKNHLLIVFLISGLTVMALFGFIVFKCLRRKRGKRYDQSAATKPDTMSNSTSAVVPTTTSAPHPPESILRSRSQTKSNEALDGTYPVPARNTLPERGTLEGGSTPSSPATASRTGYMRIVPPHKDPGTPDDQTETPGGTIKKEQVVFDWENVDPELLQHCRKTNPILHKNQYWV